MLWKIGENIIAGQVSATPKQDPGVSRYTKPMPRNGLESINSGASSCRYKYPRELRIRGLTIIILFIYNIGELKARINSTFLQRYAGFNSTFPKRYLGFNSTFLQRYAGFNSTFPK